MKPRHRPNCLIAETDAVRQPLGQTLSAHLATLKVRHRISPADYPQFRPGDLVLTNHSGRFIKPCPGTKGYNCCGLEIIHLGLGCTLGCSYCILQGYLDTPALILFANMEEAFAELTESLTDSTEQPHRYCTGEFTDSLLLEDLTATGGRLIKLFSRFSGHTLELKTKTTNISQLLDLDHGGRTIISFSVNAPLVARQEEPGAPSIRARLNSARLAAQAGYRIGFHFDPLIRHPGWTEGYARTVQDIFEAVPAGQIAWISLGAFRYLPGLKGIVRRQFRNSRIMDEEFVLAGDGKMRYLRPVRVEMYRHVLGEIRRVAPEVCVYLCMESPRVWQEVFGYDPGQEGLIHMLDRQALS